MADRTDKPLSDLKHVCFEGKPAPRTRAARPAGKTHAPRANMDLEPHDDFIIWVLARARLDAAAYRSAPLRRRLPACLRALKARSPRQARSILEARPDLLGRAIDSLLIGVTSFFREPDVFAALARDVLGPLGRLGRPLRVWSAACSNGPELYTVAILLAEARLLERTYLLGSDCRAEAIDHARTGLYDEAALRSVPPPLRRTYFQAVGDRWRPVEALRRRLHWTVGDLTRTIERGPWDVILWRNVAIYLTPAAADDLWGRLAGALSPGGVLVAGRAERPPDGAPLRPVARAVYQAWPQGAIGPIPTKTSTPSRRDVHEP